jgi:hypothetical protein
VIQPSSPRRTGERLVIGCPHGGALPFGREAWQPALRPTAVWRVFATFRTLRDRELSLKLTLYFLLRMRAWIFSIFAEFRRAVSRSRNGVALRPFDPGPEIPRTRTIRFDIGQALTTTWAGKPN